MFMFTYLLILCNAGFSTTFDVLEEKRRQKHGYFNNPVELHLTLFIYLSRKRYLCRADSALSSRDEKMAHKGWWPIMRIDEHHHSVTGLSFIQMNFLCEILCLSFKDHTLSVVGHTFLFLVVFYSRMGSTAHAVVKGAKENATWSFSFSADAVFGAFHSTFNKYTPTAVTSVHDGCLYLLHRRCKFVTSSIPLGDLGVNKCSLGLWVEFPLLFIKLFQKVETLFFWVRIVINFGRNT